ncbi:MAG: amidohydrolase, partial [Armatimonadaceae bacterium]
RYTETAIAAFHRYIPALTSDEQEEAVRRAEKVALRVGITTVGTLLDTSDQMGAYFRLHRRRELRLRVVGMPPWTSVEALHANGVGTGFGDDQLRFGGAKLFADGSFGARTALLSSPYSDHPDTTNLGIRIYTSEELTGRVVEADRKGFQIVIHAIGDQALREAIGAIETALENRPNVLRHRIEHVSLAPADLRERMAGSGILAVVQPQFVTSDTWTGERLGPDRSADAYPFRALRDGGVRLGLSSDCPVERLDPFALLAAAVWRDAWSPQGGLTLDDALEDYTMGSAYALGIENAVGSLETGKWADYVVLDCSPWDLSESEFKEMTVSETFVAGVSRERQGS